MRSLASVIVSGLAVLLPLLVFHWLLAEAMGAPIGVVQELDIIFVAIVMGGLCYLNERHPL